MVRNDWVWVWVRTVANGVAGPSRMVLPDRREWLLAMVWELLAVVRLDGDWVWE